MSETAQRVGHTPGTWTATPVGVHASTGVTVADLTKIRTTHGHDYPTSGEAIANARLIAAAPDLLAALKNLAHECRNTRKFPGALSYAYAAIAKAEGDAA